MAKKNTDSLTGTRRRSTKKDAAAAPIDISTITPTEPLNEADDRGGSSGAVDPAHDEIAQAAYDRYLKRGGGHGADFDDWLEAERELRSRRTR